MSREQGTMKPGRLHAFAFLLMLPAVAPVRADALAELNNRAVEAARAGDLETAYRLLQEAIASDPRFAVVQGNLTRVVEEISRRDYGRALEVSATPRPLALQTLDAGPAPTPDTATAGDEAGILTLLTDWSGAWSAQDVDGYLRWYAADFTPPGGLDRAAWAAQRRERLTRPRWVEVRIDQVAVVANDGREAVVRFRQDYRSDRYRDTTRKELRLRHTPDGWRIAAERSL